MTWTAFPTAVRAANTLEASMTVNGRKPASRKDSAAAWSKDVLPDPGVPINSIIIATSPEYWQPCGQIDFQISFLICRVTSSSGKSALIGITLGPSMLLSAELARSWIAAHFCTITSAE